MGKSVIIYDGQGHRSAYGMLRYFLLNVNAGDKTFLEPSMISFRH